MSSKVMFIINALFSCNRTFSKRFKNVAFSLKHFSKTSCKNQITNSFNLKSKVEKDIVLYQYEKPYFFYFLNAFSGFQCMVWSYLGWFSYTTLKHYTFVTKSENFWTNLLEKERKYADSLALVAVLVGWSIFVGTYFYTTRSVRKIILHKGGSIVTILTYGLPGFNTLKIPVKHVCTYQQRSKAKKYIAVKVKDKVFNFLLDTRGSFSDPALFDFTVGVRRGF